MLLLDTDNPKNMLEAVNFFQEAGNNLLQLKIQDSSLQEYGEKLADVYLEYGEVTGNFINALQNKNTEEGIKSHKTINQLFTKQSEIIESINNYCALN